MTVQKTAELRQAVKCKNSKEKGIDYYDLGSVQKIKTRSKRLHWQMRRWSRTNSIFNRRGEAKTERFFPYWAGERNLLFLLSVRETESASVDLTCEAGADRASSTAEGSEMRPL